MSGYINVDAETSMWFWFFEARNSPETAPLTLWLNGGPGCSSLIGLFQENGPCQVSDPLGNTTELNPYSWNNLSNMIYIDQPIGSGFSYGNVNVNSTEAAAPVFWSALQVLFKSPEFSKFQTRQFIFATESYGGHYGPAFVTYFNQQNAKIRAGQLPGGILINVDVLMINNGWFDPLLQNKAYVDFATNAPRYGQLQPDAMISSLNDAYYGPGGCQEQLQACSDAGTSIASNSICNFADTFCNYTVLNPSVGDRYQYDLRQRDPGFLPSEYYATYLASADVLDKIGAQGDYSSCSDEVDLLFRSTGDDARSVLPQLSALADSGLNILIWAGDADINCNWLGCHASALAMDWYGSKRLKNSTLTSMTFDGVTVGAAQKVDNFTFAVIYDAGHEIPSFKPAASLEVFRRMINNEPLVNPSKSF
ncbi:hypothetical protein ONZ45_g3267 [Pleurotus djamor]|nr:hypothetical protein ONZ45_g3267 [Pleurotus djamor]